MNSNNKKLLTIIVLILFSMSMITSCNRGGTDLSETDSSSAISETQGSNESVDSGSETASDSSDQSDSNSDDSDLSSDESSGETSSEESSNGSPSPTKQVTPGPTSQVTNAPTPGVTPLPTNINMNGKTVKININNFDATNIMSTQSGQYFMKHVDEIAKKFNCKIEISGIDWNTFHTKMAAGDPGADILGVGGNQNFANSMKNGWLYPLSDLGINFSQNHFDQDSQKLVLVDGKYYAAIPQTVGWENVMDTLAMFFNKKLVKDAGYNPDSLYTMQKNGTWDWAKFEEIAKKINKDTNSDGKIDVYGVANGYWDNFLWSALILSNNADWVRRPDGLMTFTGDESRAITALNFWQKLAFTNKMVYTPNDNSVDAMFVQGKIGFLPQYANRANFPAFKAMRDDWGMVLMPKGPDANRYFSPVSWYDGYSIPAAALQNDDANRTYGRQLAAIINELSKPSIPSDLISTITEIQFESLVRDEGTIETFNLIKTVKIRSEYYNGLNTVGQLLNSELINSVAIGNKDVNAVISENKTAYTNALRDQWNFLG